MALSAALKKVLADLKVGEKFVIDIVTDLDDKAEAKDKVQKANDDLTKQREKWETSEKDYKTKVEGFETSVKDKDTEIKRLQSNQLTDEDKKKIEDYKKGVMNEDVTAQFTAINSKLEIVTKSLQTEQDLRKTEQENAKTLKLDTANETLRNTLSKALTGKKILDGENTKYNTSALHTIIGEGLAKVVVNEDGTIEKKFYTRNDKKEIQTATVDELADYFASNNEGFIASSGNSGSGHDHNNSSKNHQSNYGQSRTTIAERQKNAARMLSMDK